MNGTDEGKVKRHRGTEKDDERRSRRSEKKDKKSHKHHKSSSCMIFVSHVCSMINLMCLLLHLVGLSCYFVVASDI